MTPIHLTSDPPLDYRVWAILESETATEAKTVSEFKNALQLNWSALPEKAIDNAVKDHRKRLQACVSSNVVHFEHIM